MDNAIGPLPCAEALDSSLECIANAVHIICSFKYATQACQQLLTSNVHVRSLKQLIPIFKTLGLGLGVHRPQYRKNIHDHRRKVDFARLAFCTTGVWIVRLISVFSVKVDHATMLYACRNMIIDPAEPFAISATSESTRACAGPNIQDLELAEILEIFKH